MSIHSTGDPAPDSADVHAEVEAQPDAAHDDESADLDYGFDVAVPNTSHIILEEEEGEEEDSDYDEEVEKKRKRARKPRGPKPKKKASRCHTSARWPFPDYHESHHTKCCPFLNLPIELLERILSYDLLNVVRSPFISGGKKTSRDWISCA